jgi:pilus assembly protein CpaC
MNKSHITRYSFWCSSILTLVVVIGVVVGVSSEAAWGADNEPTEKIVNVCMGQSRVIRPPWPVKRVVVTDPKIATVQVLAPTQVLVQGLAMGTTDLMLWRDDKTFQKMYVEVGANLAVLRAQLRALCPGSTLKLSQSHGVVILKGTVTRAEQALVINKFFEARGIKMVNQSKVAGVHQVLLHVRVAEVSRTAIRTLGLNLFAGGRDFFGGSLIGADGGGAIQPMSVGPAAGVNAAGPIPFTFNANVATSPGVTLFGGVPSWDTIFFLRALAENQYLRILAEPTLVALNGERANFLAGGEFPIPVVQGTATGGGTSISIEYREYGVSLSFQPTVLGDGTIRLYVAPEVSELSEIGAVTIQGFQVPSIITRRAETTLQMKSGQTFAMAGLLRRTAVARNTRLPWIGDIPILGALGRSVRYVSGETELVVLVTPTLVEPLSHKPAAPGLTHVAPNDWEFYAMGILEGPTKSTPKASREDRKWLQSMGLQNLKGPGAWAHHGQPTPHGRAVIKPIPAVKSARK